MSILLKNGTIIDYKNSIFEQYDILVENDVIKTIAKNIEESTEQIIDCTGLYIMPGMIDIHYYNKGYFDYDIHGFGPNCKTYEDTIDQIIKTIENNCIMDDKYKKRCDAFFYHKDNNSTKRVYEALIEYDK